ncbi:MAG: hypothetical protein H0T89_24805 [Deltaproteobacteria bacterium]|nr:hypothetical protein [Deltaproteobacteria bacterium]MDQ3298077.1 hypothetical protein [Myxococcota bacterium]
MSTPGPTIVAAVKLDASPPDAVPEDAAEPRELTQDEWRKLQTEHEQGVKACRQVSHPCNPPPPPPPFVVRPVLGEVTEYLELSPGQLTVNIQTTRAADHGWQGVFLDDNGVAIPGTEFEIRNRGGGLRFQAVLRGTTLPSMKVRLVPPADRSGG